MAQRDQDARRFGDIISTGFGAYYQEQDRLRQEQKQKQEQERQMAAQRAQFIQQRVPGLMASKQYDALAGLQDPYRSAIKTAYGVDLPAGAVGAPVYGPQAPKIKPALAPPSQSPIYGAPIKPLEQRVGDFLPSPSTQQLDADYKLPPELRRDFSGPQSIQAMRNLFAPEPPKLQSVGGVLYNQETGEFVVPPTAQTPETRMELESARIQGRLENTRLQGVFNLKGREIGAGATLGAAQIGAQTRMSIAQMGVQQKEQDRAFKAGVAAERFELQSRGLDIRESLGLKRIDAQAAAKIMAAAPGALENVANDLLQNKIEAAVKNAPGEDGLPNYVMSFDSEAARAKAVLSAEANGFFVSDGGVPNTIVLTPQAGMSKERGLMAATGSQGKPTTVQRRAGVEPYQPPRAAAAPGAGRSPTGKPLSPSEQQKAAENFAEVEYGKLINKEPDPEKRKQLQNRFNMKNLPKPPEYENLKRKKLEELGGAGGITSPGAGAVNTKTATDYLK
jgi:hypothetical protein